MITNKELQKYIDSLLEIERYQDYCPNGLQIAGQDQIKTIVSGVSICQELISKAIDSKADAILVHHGFFWQSEEECLRGVKRERLAALLAANINLFAYHLPLDYHPRYGNNILLGKNLGMITEEVLTTSYMRGYFAAEKSASELMQHIARVLGNRPLYIPGVSKTIKTIAWCAGGGADYMERAAEQSIDAYLTGEISEPSVYLARETGIHLFAAGHYATERYGVQALAEHLATKFAIMHNFIEVNNPI